MKNIALLAVVALITTACQGRGTYGENQNTYQGAGLGAVLGGVAGALTGEGSTDRRQKAMIGAGIGMLTGGGAGAYMDNQEAELRKSLAGKGIDIQRQGDLIILTMPENITFDKNSSAVKENFKYTLRDVSEVLSTYNNTKISVIGHTDSDGKEAYNQKLSEERAIGVSNTLRNYGIAGGRISAYGAGETQPISSNASEAGKAQNRRVEIKITPVKTSGFLG